MADYRQITGWIKKWEGGLSKSKSDYASKFPVPDGSSYHTNEGVTWKTFETLAPKLSYSATPQLFYAMPDDVWGKIFKYGYWDVISEMRSRARRLLKHSPIGLGLQGQVSPYFSCKASCFCKSNSLQSERRLWRRKEVCPNFFRLSSIKSE